MQKYKPRTTKATELEESWFMIDATGQRLGRLATVAAEYLLGKHDVKTRPYLVPKTKLVVINAEKLDITPKKLADKIYTRYSGYPGGLTKTRMHAVRGMLPKNKRGRAIIGSNLYVYVGSEHKHAAQQPQALDISKAKL
jgi:large subunit ribosomal protein L13